MIVILRTLRLLLAVLLSGQHLDLIVRPGIGLCRTGSVRAGFMLKSFSIAVDDVPDRSPKTKSRPSLHRFECHEYDIVFAEIEILLKFFIPPDFHGAGLDGRTAVPGFDFGNLGFCKLIGCA